MQGARTAEPGGLGGTRQPGGLGGTSEPGGLGGTRTTGRAGGRTDWRLAIKYALDRVLALAAILVLAPLLAMIALAVRLSSPGPVLFRQRRVGLGGEVFSVYKFRTMRDEPAAQNRFKLGAGSAPGGVEGIDRRTRIGRWLRASSLDELAQLFNVIRGHMSLIGPRPERPEFVRQFSAEIPGYADRHRVKGGITGWAQANGLRGQTSIVRRAELDNYYIDNWSLGLELKTLALTGVEVLRFRDCAPRIAADQTCASSASMAARTTPHSSCRASTADAAAEPLAA